MLFVTYDITDNKLRTEFSQFLERYGERLQYSVFMLKNSRRVINNIQTEIEAKYKKRFQDTDSILIVPISESNRKKIIRYGYERHYDDDVLYF